MIVLSMPIRNVHPDVENGTIDSEILNRLKEFDINKEKNSNFDARWDKLKELKKVNHGASKEKNFENKER